MASGMLEDTMTCDTNISEENEYDSKDCTPENDFEFEEESNPELMVDDITKAYFTEIGKYPLLTAEEEVELAKQIENGDDEAKTKMINSNLRLVASIAKRYATISKVNLLDLIQEGNIGLLTAVNRFDYRKGFKFSTYASWWIRQGITRSIFNTARAIRYPVHIGEKLSKLKKAITKVEASNATDLVMSYELLAELSGLKVQEVVELLPLINDVLSLDKPLLSDESSETSLGDFIRDSKESPEVQVINEHMKSDILATIDKVLKQKEKDIIILRFGLDGNTPRTLEEIGVMYGVTRERVRQIEKNALKKLGTRRVRDILRDYIET